MRNKSIIHLLLTFILGTNFWQQLESTNKSPAKKNASAVASSSSVRQSANVYAISGEFSTHPYDGGNVGRNGRGRGNGGGRHGLRNKVPAFQVPKWFRKNNVKS